MNKLILACLLGLMAQALRAQTVHDYASVEFSPGIRKLGVFGTSLPSKVIDLKTLHMSKRDQDILTFFTEVQELERQGWQVASQDMVALDRGLHMYVWTLRKARP